MSSMKWTAVAVILLSSPGICLAQTESSPVTGATPPALAPGTPDGSYSLSRLESISQYNGHLSFHVPLLNIGGRGEAGYTMYATIEKSWYIETTDYGGGYYTYAPVEAYWNSIDAGYGPGVLFYRLAQQSGPNLCSTSVDPTAVTDTLTRLTMRFPDHSEEELIDQRTNGKSLTPSVCGVGPNDPATLRGSIFVSHGGEGDKFVADSDLYDFGAKPDGTFVRKNGLQYRIEGELTRNITDRNGNQVQFLYDMYSRVAGITDALGRQITVTYRSGLTGCDVISYNGANGAARTSENRFWDTTNSYVTTTRVMTWPETFFPCLIPMGTRPSLAITMTKATDMLSRRQSRMH